MEFKKKRRSQKDKIPSNKKRKEPLKNNTEPESTQNSTESLSVHFACMVVFTLKKKKKRVYLHIFKPSKITTKHFFFIEE